MFTSLLAIWQQLPEATRERISSGLRHTGVPYCASYLAKYKEVHDSTNFCGNLPSIKEEYEKSTGQRRASLANQFDKVVDSLVMKNGVKKTTYSMRQLGILAALVEEERFSCHKEPVTVLDIPSSTGIASLDFYDLLVKFYKVRAYVLGDLYFTVLYDRERECIFDEEGNLLQVKLRNGFFSLYRPHSLGDRYNIWAGCLLIPLGVASSYLRRKYPYRPENDYQAIALLHPDVEKRLGDGSLSVRRMDVFKVIEDKFDIIISFNLLQRNYFPVERIQRGIENLKNALNEDGLLIMGNTESYSVSRKVGGELVVVKREGEF